LLAVPRFAVMLRLAVLFALSASVIAADDYAYDERSPEQKAAAAEAAAKLDAEVAAKLPLPCLRFAREQKLGMKLGEGDVLTKEELRSFAKDPEVSGLQPRPDCLDTMLREFGTLDRDGDGKVKMDELMVTLLQAARDTVKEELR